MKQALNHLIDLGHRRIGLIVGLPVRATAERKAALTAAFEERGLDPTYLIFESDDLSFDSGRDGARALLDDPTPPTAILVGGNQLVVGALTEIRSRGLRIPEDLSIVSTDDIGRHALFLPTPIATVRRDNVELGAGAATLLLERTHHQAQAQGRRPPRHLSPWCHARSRCQPSSSPARVAGRPASRSTTDFRCASSSESATSGRYLLRRSDVLRCSPRRAPSRALVHLEASRLRRRSSAGSQRGSTRSGQTELSAAGCRDLMQEGAIDYCNFDASWSGGPTERRRVAAVAATYNVKMAHHEEPHIGAHLLASISHGTFMETFHPDRDPIWWNLVANRPKIVDGVVTLPNEPGLGWELDEDYIEAHRIAEEDIDRW